MKIFKLHIHWDATYRQAVRMKSERYDRLREKYLAALDENLTLARSFDYANQQITGWIRRSTEQVERIVADAAEIARLREIEAEYRRVTGSKQ